MGQGQRGEGGSRVVAVVAGLEAGLEAGIGTEAGTVKTVAVEVKVEVEPAVEMKVALISEPAVAIAVDMPQTAQRYFASEPVSLSAPQPVLPAPELRPVF